MKKQILLGVLLSTSAVFFMGCDFLSKKAVAEEKIKAASKPMAPQEAAQHDPDDPVLVKVDGKPVVYKKAFLEFAEQALKANPYLANFGITSYEAAPAPIKEQLIEAMVQQQLVTNWAHDEGIANTDQFQEDFAKTCEQVKQALLAQTFEKQILDTITVTDQEIEQEYQTTRERFVKGYGSLTVVGASFTDQAQADQFHDAVAVQQVGAFNQVAEQMGALVKEFGKISRDPRVAMSGDVPFNVRKAVFSLEDDHYFARAQEGDAYWVLQVVDRERAEYMSFEEVAPQVAEMVKANKFRTARDERLAELRGQHTVDIDTSSLGDAQADPYAALQQALAAAQGEADDQDHHVTTSA